MYLKLTTYCFLLIFDSLYYGHCSSSEAEKLEESPGEDVVSETNYGKLKGFVVADQLMDGGHRKTNVFLGIPFAKPPIAELRFEKPIAPNKWKDVRNATAFGPACFPHHAKEFRQGQASAHSEDCLYLNVFAPHSKSPKPNGYPVLVFIHGGCFEVGSAVDFGWKSLADMFVSQDLVVVTIQYRLGPLGFAASGDESFPGNLGLWDARMALHYINQNIHHFGGDPKRVTAWGHSAGSAAVSALSLSTHSQDLFAQSIQMSGAVFGEWTTSNRVIQETDKLATALNCDKHLADSKQLKKCLRKKSVHEILDGVDKIIPGRRDVNMAKFGPRLDADFFTDDYPQLIESANKKPTLIGVTESEAISFTLFGALSETVNYLYVGPEKLKTFAKSDFDNFLVEVIASEAVFGDNANQVQKKISAFYLHNPENRPEDTIFYLEKYTEIVSDIVFVVPTLIEARHKTRAGWPVFLYQVEHFNPNEYPPGIPVKGSYHGVEYPYLFPVNPFVPPFKEYSHEDKNFQKHLLDSIISFTKYGKLSVDSTKWPVLSESAPLTYALLNGDEEVKVLQALAPHKLKFWQGLRDDYDFDIVRGFHKKTLASRDEL